ncbi:MAG TPA: carboxypeptidase-like regulatory domain-containing protein [Gemmatimonadaceae bacterium]|jgi:hypothetical protein|nr:carboxypeptidase-like regulatory domain-containing protein [Gemmatimonadaceae bacterium]
MITLFVNFIALALPGQPCIDGRVLEAEADRPVAKATISAAWTEVRVNKKKREVDEIRVARDTTTDSTGHYHICATAGASVLVQVRAGQSNAYYPLTVEDSGAVAPDLKVSAHDEPDRASVTGTVVSETGAPVSGATITLLGTSATTRTSTDGTYGMRELPAGSQILVARSIGRGAAVVAVELSGRNPTTVAMTMQQLPPTLAVVDIVADRLQLSAIYREIGFTKRQRIGNGKFLTQDQIENRGALQTPEIFRGLPGVRVVDDHYGVLKVYSDRGPSTILGYGDCTAYVVDGTMIGWGKSTDMPQAGTNEPFGGPDELMLPPPGQIIAAEVYQSNEPAPFVNMGPAMRCLKIILWTKAQLAGRG